MSALAAGFAAEALSEWIGRHCSSFDGLDLVDGHVMALL